MSEINALKAQYQRLWRQKYLADETVLCLAEGIGDE